MALCRLGHKAVSLDLRGLWAQLRESGTVGTSHCRLQEPYRFHTHVANSYVSFKAGPEYPYWRQAALD